MLDEIHEQQERFIFPKYHQNANEKHEQQDRFILVNLQSIWG
jgi:hypothetical protein